MGISTVSDMTHVIAALLITILAVTFRDFNVQHDVTV